MPDLFFPACNLELWKSDKWLWWCQALDNIEWKSSPEGRLEVSTLILSDLIHSPPPIQNKKFWNWTFWNVGQSSYFLSCFLLSLLASFDYLCEEGTEKVFKFQPFPQENTTLSLLHMGAILTLINSIWHLIFTQLQHNLKINTSWILLHNVLMHHARRAVQHSWTSSPLLPVLQTG